MTAPERLIATAKAQEGYMGKKSAAQLDDPKANAGGRFNKFARDLDALGDFYNGRKNGYDWCDVFVDWCFVTTFGRDIAQKLLCQPDKSCGAGTGYSLGYYKAKGRFFTSPQPADQIFFGDAKVTKHTGIVTDVRGGYVYTEEGNAGSPSAVRARKYKLEDKDIKGYGRPDWSLVPADKPAQTTKEDDDMTYYKTLADVPSWYKEPIQLLVNKGALKGTGNGELNVSEDFCRVMTALYRLGKLG